jgi:segregation and condensation protein A
MADGARGLAVAAPRPPASDDLTLQLGAYEGPLDLLLELARAQRVDLTRVSVLTLAEQFVVAVEAAIAGGRVPLSTIGGWLVTAASLLALRARLLLPAGSPENREAEREAAALRRRLADRAAVRHLAAWLEQRPQLGREIFRRGAREPEPMGPPVADITALLRACLRLLELPARERVYRPNPPALWRVPDAIAQVRGLLAELPSEGMRLAALLPAAGERMATPLQRRAALASTLLAGLELTREGALTLEQHAAFGEIRAGRPVPSRLPTANERRSLNTVPAELPGLAAHRDDKREETGIASPPPARAASRSPRVVRR